MKRAVRQKLQFAVLVIDLDGLKQVNGVHGHRVGREHSCATKIGTEALVTTFLFFITFITPAFLKVSGSRVRAGNWWG